MAQTTEQTFMESVSEEVTLTLGDRINFPYILAQQIITFQKSIVKDEGKQSLQEIMEAAQGLYELIPDAWRIGDKGFNEEIDKATILVPIDQRRYWCGIPIGKPNYVFYKFNHPYKIFHACMNLLQRKGLLARTLYTEIKTGREYLIDAIETAEKESLVNKPS